MIGSLLGSVGGGLSGYTASQNALSGLGGQNMSGVLGFLGNLAGSMMNYSSAKSDRSQSNKQLKWWLAQQQRQIQWRVEDAKKAGIHPLAALGISPSSGPNVQLPEARDYSYGLGKAGQSLDDLINKTLNPDVKRMRQLSQEGVALDNDFKRVQIEKARRDLNGSITLDSSPTGSSYNIIGQGGKGTKPGVVFKKKEVIPGKMPGVEVGDVQMQQYSIHKGVKRLELTRDMAESQESAIFSKLLYNAKEGMDWLKGISDVALHFTEKASRHRSEIMRFRPKDNPPGYEYRYLPGRGGWILAKIGKGRYGSRYYGDDRLRYIDNKNRQHYPRGNKYRVKMPARRR